MLRRRLCLCCCVVLSALLMGPAARLAHLASPRLSLACTPDTSPPAQQKMPAPRKLARQSRFREHSSQDQPTLSQLLSAAADAPSSSAPSVTAILNHWKRTTLCRQIEALRSQTAPLAHIWICLFASPIAESARLAALAYNDSRIAVFEADANLKYYGRFQVDCCPAALFPVLSTAHHPSSPTPHPPSGLSPYLTASTY